MNWPKYTHIRHAHRLLTCSQGQAMVYHCKFKVCTDFTTFAVLYEIFHNIKPLYNECISWPSIGLMKKKIIENWVSHKLFYLSKNVHFSWCLRCLWTELLCPSCTNEVEKWNRFFLIINHLWHLCRTRAHLGCVTHLGRPRSVYKSDVKCWFLEFWGEMAKITL